MQRSFISPAIIINLRPLGENNSSVTLVTPDKGIIYATLYGGPKSKLRSLVTQWNTGTVWLYENPEKNQIKISDFEVKSYHSTFSQNLFKLYAANLSGELVLKTSCAGSNKQCFSLLAGFLDGMDLCDEAQSRVGLLRFLWRYLELLGVQPQAHCCGGCGKSFLNQQFANDNVSYYNGIENIFVCSDCISSVFTNRESLRPIAIKTSAVQYLAAISVLSPAEVRKLQITKQDYEQIKEIVFFLIENSVEQKLNSIETGMGIL